MSTKRQKREKKQEIIMEENRKKQKYSTSITLGFIFLLSFIFFFWGAATLPVTDPVESNYALTAKEMVESGDFLSPQIYHTYWYDKPIMVYWLTALSYVLFGFTDWAARLPSALCGALTIPTLTWYIHRITKNNGVAIWSGAILATSLECWLLSHAIITDAILMLFTVITLLSAYIGVTEHKKYHLVIAYVASGLACLTKGPVGLVLPGLILLLWCAVERNKTYLLRLFPWQGILAFFLTALPWYGAMYHIHGMPFINEFLGLHNILRATVSEHPGDNHFYYYLVVFPLSLLPWTGLFFYSLKKYIKSKDAFIRFLLTWCATVLVFYTLMATKYITYTYIAVAPAAILTAMATTDVTEGKKGAVLSLFIPFFLLMALFVGISIYIPHESWWALYLIIAYAVWALLIRRKKMEGKRLTTIFTVTASSILLVILNAFPTYMNTRTFKETASLLASLPGEHYFYRAYPTSYPYYTGDYAPRIMPDDYLSSGYTESKEKRDARWDNKAPFPTITDSKLEAQPKDIAISIFVKKNLIEEFENSPYGKTFIPLTETAQGRIYQRKELP